MPPFSVSRKVCAVFGGSGGIGRAICHAFAQQGEIVAVIGRDGKSAMETSDSLPCIESNCHASFSCNVEDCTQVEETVKLIESTVGKIGVLVNAAGINKDSLLVRAKTLDIENMMGTNLLGVLYTSRAVLKSMMKRKEGCIVNIGSIAGQKGNTGQTVYSATKAGLVGFTKSLAKEVGSRGIRINLVVPGFIKTDMTHELRSHSLSSLESMIPLGRFGEPAEVANAVCFLVRSPYITGQVLMVDGGLQMVI